MELSKLDAAVRKDSASTSDRAAAQRLLTAADANSALAVATAACLNGLGMQLF